MIWKSYIEYLKEEKQKQQQQEDQGLVLMFGFVEIHWRVDSGDSAHYKGKHLSA